MNTNSKTISYVLLLIGLCIVILHPGCRCKCTNPTDPKCSNYDPCYGLTETKADFWVYEKYSPHIQGINYLDSIFTQNLDIINSDTFKQYHWKIFNGKYDFQNGLGLTFKCKNKNATEVKWYIGNNAILTGSEVYLEFDTTQFKTYKVMMVVKYNKQGACFKNETGLDTVTKYITLKMAGLPDFVGKYTGYLTSKPNEEVKIELKYIPCTFNPQTSYCTSGPFINYCNSDTGIYVTGLPKEADIPVFQVFHAYTKSFIINWTFECTIVNAQGTHMVWSANGEYDKGKLVLTFDYGYLYTTDFRFYKDQFIGYKN